MPGKQNYSRRGAGEAAQVFRQFAWNLAGTLAGARAGTPRASTRPRTAKTGAAR